MLSLEIRDRTRNGQIAAGLIAHVPFASIKTKASKRNGLAARRHCFVRWTLAPAGMDQCIEEPERRVTPWGDERLVFFFSGLRQDLLSSLPFVHGLPCRLPPKRPRATPRARPRQPPRGGCFPGRTVRRAPAACVQRWDQDALAFWRRYSA